VHGPPSPTAKHLLLDPTIPTLGDRRQRDDGGSESRLSPHYQKPDSRQLRDCRANVAEWLQYSAVCTRVPRIFARGLHDILRLVYEQSPVHLRAFDLSTQGQSRRYVERFHWNNI
jgi:hypothetical protein